MGRSATGMAVTADLEQVDHMDSIWVAGGKHWGRFSALSGSIEVDTAIVGGGITGINTALRLSEAGQRVAVLEKARIGACNSGC